MTQFLNWFLVLLSLLTVGAASTELLIGQEGVKRTKDRLADWYVSIEDADWHDLIRNGASVTDRALSGWLGVKIFSRKAIFRWALFSYGVTLLCAIPLAQNINTTRMQPQNSLTLALLTVLVTLLLGTPSFLVDIMCLALNRVVFRKLSDPRSSVWFILYTLCASYAAIAVVILGVSLILPGSRASAGWALVWPYVLAVGPQHDTFLFVWLLFPAILSSIMLGLACAVSLLLFVTRSYSKKLVSLIVERMAEAPKGALTAITAIATAVTAIATNLEHALMPAK